MNIKSLLLVMVLVATTISFGQHPLISDDAGTVGANTLQLEFTPEITRSSHISAYDLPLAVSFGLLEKSDIVLSIPYCRIDCSMQVEDAVGFHDVLAEFKYRFFTSEIADIAIKPGVTLPFGDFDEGLSSGLTGYSIFLITDSYLNGTRISLNAGYFRNENKLEEKIDLFHFSVSTFSELNEKLALVTNAGVESNPIPGDESLPYFILAGGVFNLNNLIDLDTGFKLSRSRDEMNYSLLTGITLVFN